jgi:RNA polymerase sigma-70 factor (ECF subfamily)
MASVAELLAVKAGKASLVRDFGSWMAAEQRRVYQLCYRFLRDCEEADAATQDVFLKAYQSLKKDGRELDDPAKWLTRIAVNTCLDRLRSRKWQFWRRRPEADEEVRILAEATAAEPDAERLSYSRQVNKRLHAALDRLSGRQRAVFTLRHFEDLSLDEIAEALGLDVGTVKAHMFRALAKLRTELRDLYAERRS